MFSTFRKTIIFISISIVVLFLTSCNSHDPVAPQEDHFEAIGTVIYDATGAEIVRILRGITSDTLTAQVGVLSDHYNVKFINDDEEVVDPPTDDPEQSMEVSITETNLLETETDMPGAFEFHLRGKATGNTTIEIKLLHNGHSDYRSGLIPVKIVD